MADDSKEKKEAEESQSTVGSVSKSLESKQSSKSQLNKTIVLDEVGQPDCSSLAHIINCLDSKAEKICHNSQKTDGKSTSNSKALDKDNLNKDKKELVSPKKDKHFSQSSPTDLKSNLHNQAEERDVTKPTSDLMGIVPSHELDTFNKEVLNTEVIHMERKEIFRGEECSQLVPRDSLPDADEKTKIVPNKLDASNKAILKPSNGEFSKASSTASNDSPKEIMDKENDRNHHFTFNNVEDSSNLSSTHLKKSNFNLIDKEKGVIKSNLQKQKVASGVLSTSDLESLSNESIHSDRQEPFEHRTWQSGESHSEDSVRRSKANQHYLQSHSRADLKFSRPEVPKSHSKRHDSSQLKPRDMNTSNLNSGKTNTISNSRDTYFYSDEKAKIASSGFNEEILDKENKDEKELFSPKEDKDSYSSQSSSIDKLATDEIENVKDSYSSQSSSIDKLATDEIENVTSYELDTLFLKEILNDEFTTDGGEDLFSPSEDNPSPLIPRHLRKSNLLDKKNEDNWPDASNEESLNKIFHTDGKEHYSTRKEENSANLLTRDLKMSNFSDIDKERIPKSYLEDKRDVTSGKFDSVNYNSLNNRPVHSQQKETFSSKKFDTSQLFCRVLEKPELKNTDKKKAVNAHARNDSMRIETVHSQQASDFSPQSNPTEGSQLIHQSSFFDNKPSSQIEKYSIDKRDTRTESIIPENLRSDITSNLTWGAGLNNSKYPLSSSHDSVAETSEWDQYYTENTQTTRGPESDVYYTENNENNCRLQPTQSSKAYCDQNLRPFEQQKQLTNISIEPYQSYNSNNYFGFHNNLNIQINNNTSTYLNNARHVNLLPHIDSTHQINTVNRDPRIVGHTYGTNLIPVCSVNPQNQNISSHGIESSSWVFGTNQNLMNVQPTQYQSYVPSWNYGASQHFQNNIPTTQFVQSQTSSWNSQNNAQPPQFGYSQTSSWNLGSSTTFQNNIQSTLRSHNAGSTYGVNQYQSYCSTNPGQQATSENELANALRPNSPKLTQFEVIQKALETIKKSTEPSQPAPPTPSSLPSKSPLQSEAPSSSSAVHSELPSPSDPPPSPSDPPPSPSDPPPSPSDPPPSPSDPPDSLPSSNLHSRLGILHSTPSSASSNTSVHKDKMKEIPRPQLTCKMQSLRMDIKRLNRKKAKVGLTESEKNELYRLNLEWNKHRDHQAALKSGQLSYFVN